MPPAGSRAPSSPTSWPGWAAISGATRPTPSPNPSVRPAPPGGAPGCGWTPAADGRAGFHRYHSAELVTDLRCAQLPVGMLDGLHDCGWPPGAQLHVAVDDDGERHVVQSGPRTGAQVATQVVEGRYEAMQRVNERVWRVPVTAFWQAHREAATGVQRAGGRLGAAEPGHDGVGSLRRRRGFRRGAGRGRRRRRARASPSTRRAAPRVRRGPRWPTWAASRSSPTRCARALSAQTGRADVAVLDPPRSGAGREVIDLLAAADVPRIVHIGCEAASFARDVGLYLGARLHRGGPAGVRLLPADPPRRVRRGADALIELQRYVPCRRLGPGSPNVRLLRKIGRNFAVSARSAQWAPAFTNFVQQLEVRRRRDTGETLRCWCASDALDDDVPRLARPRPAPCGTGPDLTRQRTGGVLSPPAGGQGRNRRARAPVASGR